MSVMNWRDLAEAAQKIGAYFPDSILEYQNTGYLIIFDEDQWVGHIDLMHGNVTFLDKSLLDY
jgi:hypothetical protein